MWLPGFEPTTLVVEQYNVSVYFIPGIQAE
jgi:hypothetical protein